MSSTRRRFLSAGASLGAVAAFGWLLGGAGAALRHRWRWSLHRTLRGGQMTNSLPRGTEFASRLASTSIRSSGKRRATGHWASWAALRGQRRAQPADRSTAGRRRRRRRAGQGVENHHRWIDAAAFWAISVRVNAAARAIQGTAKRGGFAGQARQYSAKHINVIVENHGGWSSNGEWLAGVVMLTTCASSGSPPDAWAGGRADHHRAWPR